MVAHPVLRRLLPGFTLSYLGDAMSLLAVSWLAIQLAPGRAAGLWVAAAVAAYTLPGVLGTVLFGRLLAGRSGAQLAAWDATLRAAGLFLIPICYLAGVLEIWLYVTLLGLSALLSAWGSAGRFTLVAELLPERHRLAGNALISLLGETSGLFGPALAAIVIAFGGPVLVITIDAATFAVLALSYAFGVPRTARAAPEDRPTARLAGFALIRADRRLLGLVTLVFAFFFLYGPVQVALPIHAARELGSAGALAAFWTVFGVGAVIGGFAAGYLRRWRLWPTTIGIVIGWGAALLPLGFGAPTGVALAAFALGGLIWAPFPATTMAMLQRSTDDRTRAQVLAAYSALAMLSVPLGTMVGGPLVTGLGARATILAAGLATVAVGAVAAWVVLRHRHHHRTLPPHPQQENAEPRSH
ncbi:MFS transporter [Solwaraspora sp. WMMD1047]|uniref:MFS transporter n=1 Tax=Solwaraspora sp. WMMD1047 TaxID=3016102 RepID=UPI0024165785|nr:MFS transporter [Solwaraspora sp. WMMD1047]MDG4827825.1 MFS transporter [Solwaraspora sp. WMMD1047]